jgi:hypothetical protein
MAAILSVEPAYAPNSANGREHKGRTALDAGAEPQRSARSRERVLEEGDPYQTVRPGMLINIEV